MKKYFFPMILAVSLASIPINAQQKGANISFDETIFNFGKINENKGEVIHKFEFTNTGSESMVIQNVSTSCGCTTPDWTKGPVRPGEKGFVSAAYNPSGRPGQFEKYITVQSTANPSLIQLKITGQVNPKILSIEDQYPFPFGGIRLKSNQVSFGTVFKGQERSNIIEVINASDQNQTIKIEGTPPYIKVNIPKPTLAPKQTGIIEITFNSAMKDDWGFVMDRLNVYINNKTDNSYRIISSANIEEDFSSLSADQRLNSPKVSFENTTYNFGTVKSGLMVTHEFRFTNNGKTNLFIRKITASCGCTAVNASEQVIAPGKTGTIKANFNSTGYSGTQNKTITVITNDPVNSKVLLWIKGAVTNGAK